MLDAKLRAWITVAIFAPVVFLGLLLVAENKAIQAENKARAIKNRPRMQRRQVERDAHFISLALLMYATDYPVGDDLVFPPQGADLPRVLAPYMKAPRAFEPVGTAPSTPVVVYTFRGSRVRSGGKNPAPSPVEIAYKKGPGGRALIYANGDVKWKPDP